VLFSTNLEWKGKDTKKIAKIWWVLNVSDEILYQSTMNEQNAEYIKEYLTHIYGWLSTCRGLKQKKLVKS
jgi:hypothetical protein